MYKFSSEENKGQEDKSTQDPEEKVSFRITAQPKTLVDPGNTLQKVGFCWSLLLIM